MGHRHKVLFVCYLFMSSMILSTAQQTEIKVTDEIVNEIAEEFLGNFEKELDDYYGKAPEDPNNAIDEVGEKRAFFLLPFLPKLCILLVKLAIKVVPLIIKAAVVVKAKAAAVAVAGLAKVSTVAALKSTAIAVGKVVLVDVVTSVVIDVVTDQISQAISPSEAEPSSSELQQKNQLNLIDFYEMNSEVCKCKRKESCYCCVKPKTFENACVHFTLTDNLWNNNSFINVGTFYGGKEVMIRKLKVNRPRQKCQLLSPPFNTTNMCVSTWGRDFRGKRVIQCFSVYFNRRGISKCLVQNEDLRLWFRRD